MADRTSPERIPNRVHAHRTARGMSQQALADAVGLSAQHVARLERGERDLLLSRLYRIAAALCVHPADLLDGGPPAPSPAEARLQALWSVLPDERREILLKVAEAMAKPARR